MRAGTYVVPMDDSTSWGHRTPRTIMLPFDSHNGFYLPLGLTHQRNPSPVSYPLCRILSHHTLMLLCSYNIPGVVIPAYHTFERSQTLRLQNQIPISSSLLALLRTMPEKTSLDVRKGLLSICVERCNGATIHATTYYLWPTFHLSSNKTKPTFKEAPHLRDS